MAPVPFILDMVHHNPGEPPFQTAFLDPAHLAEYGFNGQVFKHINCLATFEKLGIDVFPPGSPDRQWLDAFLPPILREIAAAKDRGLQVFYHLDLFVLPRRLVERYREEICDEQTGRILLDRPRTMELHRVLFDELCERFPQVDGYIIRVGETYLFDTPYHVGNGPIPRVGPAWTPTYFYDQAMGKAPPVAAWTVAQADAYLKLIEFLREHVCTKHEKYILFRTWDIFPDKLHAVPQHYLQVTNRIEPHPKLLFSIKHTALDFWRRVKVNPCLTIGRHPQVIEVQCQREYEGKGAFPNYVMAGVLNGFPENAKPIGLKDLLAHPTVRGIYSWSRGGGWYGPYIKDELWCDLNAYVLAQFAAHFHEDPRPTEEQIFRRYAVEKLNLGGQDVNYFRRLCLLSAEAVLKGRHCAAFDAVLRESVLPTALWMRDDRLGGFEQLGVVLDYLQEHGLQSAALEEKAQAGAIWDEMAALAREIHWPDAQQGERVRGSVEYGRRLFRVVERGWRVMIAGHRHQGGDAADELRQAIATYDQAWHDYRALSASRGCASLYEGRYFSLPGSPDVPGLDATVDQCRAMIRK